MLIRFSQNLGASNRIPVSMRERRVLPGDTPKSNQRFGNDQPGALQSHFDIQPVIFKQVQPPFEAAGAHDRIATEHRRGSQEGESEICPQWPKKHALAIAPANAVDVRKKIDVARSRLDNRVCK